MTMLRPQTMLRQHVRRKQATTLPAVRGNAAEQTGNAIGGAKWSQRLRVRGASSRPAATATPPALPPDIVAPVGHGLEHRLCLGLARIDQRQQIAAVETPAVDRGKQWVGHLVPAVGPFHHLAPPVQSDQCQRRLRHGLARPRQFMVERVQHQQRIAFVRRCEQRGEETVGIMPANQRGDRRVHARQMASVANPCQLDAFQHGS